MMMQSIPVQASGMVNGAMGFADIVRRSGESKFELFLDNRIKTETKISDKAKAVNVGKADRTDNTSPEKSNQIKDAVKGIVNTAVESDKGLESTVNVDNQPVDGQEAPDLMTSDIMEQILAMLGQIKDIIMEKLDLTPEELDQMMTDLGLELTDLVDPQAIMKLVLVKYNSTDPMAIVFDEQLTNTFKDLLTAVNDIRKEANLKLTDEEIELLLEQNTDTFDNEISVDDMEAETLQSMTGSKQDKDESEEVKNSTISRQSVSEDSEISNQNHVAASKNVSKERKEGSDKTDGYESFLDKLSANYDKHIIEFSNDTVRLYEIRDIAQQIIEQIRVIISPEQTSMELQLYPEHLGKVNLTVSSREGVMTAHFVVQNEIAKEAVEGQLITLKETLAQQGIKVETIEVTVASYTFDQSPYDEAEQSTQSKQGTRHKITFEEAVAMSEDPIEETDTKDPSGNIGYTIDYTA